MSAPDAARQSLDEMIDALRLQIGHEPTPAP
jgi:hypothetical protein